MLKTYNGHEVTVSVGVKAIRGFVEGDAITVEREADSWTDVAGLNGEVARSGNNDKRGTITLRLMQTSEDNDYLSALAVADELSKTGVVPILIRDVNGNSLYASEESWIRKPTTASFGKEAGEREWVLRCAKLEVFTGGN